MTDTFVADQATEGTPVFNSTDVDQGKGTESNPDNNIQQQIDVMQKRITDKDDFIDTLKSENQTLREKMAEVEEKVQSMGTVEQALARMKEQQTSNQDTTLDEDKLVSKVLGSIEAKTLEESQTANFKEVSSKLTKLYGADKVDETIDKVATENGLTRSDVADLAKKSPQAVYRMMGIDQSSTSFTPSHSTNVGQNDDAKSREQKLAEFSKLRKEDPKKYMSPEVQKAFRQVCLSK